MPSQEKRVVELANADRHLLERIAKALEKQGRPMSQQEAQRRQTMFEEFFGPFGERTPKSYPYESGDVLVLGPELFLSADARVLSYKGQEYYKPCGEFVTELSDGARTHCVRIAGHPRNEHEDVEGRINTGFAG